MRVALASRRVLANRRFFSTDDDVPVNAKLRSSGVARATIIGNVGSDPKIMKFDDGGIAAQFSLATSNVVKRQDGSLESKTEWFLAVSRNQVVAETLEKIIKKGMMVYVEGPIELKEYTDKTTGSSKKTVAVRLSNTNQFKILKYPYNAEAGGQNGGGRGGSNGVFEGGKDNGQVYD